MRILLLILTFIYLLNAKELEKVSLQLQWLNQFQFAGYYMAKEKGFYKNIGLDVEIKEMTKDIVIVDQVMDRKSTYGIGKSSLIVDKANGKKIKLLLSIFQSSPLILLARKDSNIKTIKDFIGKRVMIMNDAASTASLCAIQKKYGVNKSDIVKQAHTFNIDDLINKKTDLMESYISNEPFLMKEKGVEYTIFDPKKYGFDIYNDMLFTSDYEIENHKQRAINFKTASFNGWEYAFNNIDETVDIILKKYNTQGKTREALLFEAKKLKELAYYETTKIGEINKEKLHRIYDIYNLLGLVEASKVSDIDNIVFDEKEESLFSEDEKMWLKNRKSITMCIDPNWLPFEKFEKNIHVGVTADYFKLFEKYIDKKIEIVKTKTWTQSLEFAQKRKCDILSLAMETSTRKEYLNFTDSYLSIPLVLATKNNVTFISEIETLNGKKICIPKGYAFEEILKFKYPFLKIIEVENISEGLKKVDKNEAFGYFGTMASIAYMIQNEFYGDLKIAGKFDERWELGVGVRNDDITLLNIFNKAISKIEKSQEQSILNKWIPITYEKRIDYYILFQVLGVVFIIFLFFLYRHYLLKQTNKKLQEQVAVELEKSRLQDKKILQQSRLAQMGEMISMIAHQWRQPLSSMSSATSNLILKLELKSFDMTKQSEIDRANQYFLERLEKILGYVKVLDITIKDFTNFYKPDKKPVNAKLEDIISKSLSVIQESLEKDNIEIVKDYNSHKELIVYDSEIMQVVLNILQNARDNFRDKQIKNPKILITTKDQKISISDNGGGIPENIIEHIFDPYFSTKDEKNGTGLGLYMSKTIVEEHHNGSLEVENINHGTCFSIFIGDNK